MKKIQSFTVNHLKLLPGLYVSRKDTCDGTVVTTFDLRFVAPNVEPVLDTAPLHTIEHLGATFLRNSAHADKIVYFGPMGCRTGFYLVMFGDLQSEDVYPLVVEFCQFVENFDGPIPGASAVECGNWQDQNLAMAKYHTARYHAQLVEYKRFVYPQ